VIGMALAPTADSHLDADGRLIRAILRLARARPCKPSVTLGAIGKAAVRHKVVRTIGHSTGVLYFDRMSNLGVSEECRQPR
jgi:hypothetical protein